MDELLFLNDALFERLDILFQNSLSVNEVVDVFVTELVSDFLAQFLQLFVAAFTAWVVGFGGLVGRNFWRLLRPQIIVKRSILRLVVQILVLFGLLFTLKIDCEFHPEEFLENYEVDGADDNGNNDPKTTNFLQDVLEVYHVQKRGVDVVILELPQEGCVQVDVGGLEEEHVRLLVLLLNIVHLNWLVIVAFVAILVR